MNGGNDSNCRADLPEKLRACPSLESPFHYGTVKIRLVFRIGLRITYPLG